MIMKMKSNPAPSQIPARYNFFLTHAHHDYDDYNSADDDYDDDDVIRPPAKSLELFSGQI